VIIPNVISTKCGRALPLSDRPSVRGLAFRWENKRLINPLRPARNWFQIKRLR